MTALWLVVSMLAGPLADGTLRVAAEPRRVCLDAQRALFRLENAGETPLLVGLSIERWSGADDPEDWTTIQQDVTERNATSEKTRSVKVEARGRREVFWVLKGRKGPPLATGRHRLVVSLTDKAGGPTSRVLHEFVIADCGE